MEIRHTVFKRKKGRTSGKGPKLFGKGQWVARVQHFEVSTGKWRTWERTAATKGAAVDLKDARIRELEKSAKPEGLRRGEKLSFSEFADECLRTIYKPAEYDKDGYRFAGSRTPDKAKSFIGQLKRHFGDRLLRDLTHTDLEAYRAHRLAPSDANVKPVSQTTVNRELAHLSRIWTEARRRGFVTSNLFEHRNEVIVTSREKVRTRILSEAEETRLLAACDGKYGAKYVRTLHGKKSETDAGITLNSRNPALRALIVMAIETGCRQGELFKLEWKDLDFENNKAIILSTHTKTEKTREVPLTPRAIRELNYLRETLAKMQTNGKALRFDLDRPFAFNNVKRGFKRACELANIEGLHFHDLRRTAISRWQAAGVSLTQAQKWAGHANSKMTLEVYTAADERMHRDNIGLLAARETPAQDLALIA